MLAQELACSCLQSESLLILGFLVVLTTCMHLEGSVTCFSNHRDHAGHSVYDPCSYYYLFLCVRLLLLVLLLLL